MRCLTLLALCLPLLWRSSYAWAAAGYQELRQQYSQSQNAPARAGCWEELRSFTTPFGESIDYCRGRLRFSPGALDCYYFPERVCAAFLQAQQQWSTTRTPLPARVIECPETPKPPPCPRFRPGSGFGLSD